MSKTCKIDGSVLDLKKAKITEEKLKKQYYYTHYFLCKRCNRIYFSDTYKIENKKMDSLIDLSGNNDFDIEIWTDGASSKNGSEDAKAAWAYVSRVHEEAGLVEGKQTNNVAEAMAILKALEWAGNAGYRKIKIHTDSQISIYSLSKSHEKVKANSEIFAKIARIIDNYSLEVSYVKVAGHSGDVNNDRADVLAATLAQG
jgi:ribonuclease HI